MRFEKESEWELRRGKDTPDPSWIWKDKARGSKSSSSRSSSWGSGIAHNPWALRLQLCFLSFSNPGLPRSWGPGRARGFAFKSSGPAPFQTPANLALLANPPPSPGLQQTQHQGPRPCHLLPEGSPGVLVVVVGGDTSLASAWRGTGGGARPESQGEEEEWVASAYPRHAPPNPLGGGEPRPAPRKPGATYQPAWDNAVLGTSAMVAALGWRGRRGAEWGGKGRPPIRHSKKLTKEKEKN